MHISLIVATIGRTTELARLLESLCSQSYTNFQVLINDQNPEGFLDETLTPFYSRLNIAVRVTKPVGVSAARNELLPHITGDIVAFPDDDCWYAPDTLEKVVCFFKNQSTVGAIMGVWADNLQKLEEQTQFEPQKLSTRAIFSRGETYVQFYTRSIIDNVKNFDTQLGPGTGLPYGCGEDTDYMLRAAQFTHIYRVPSVRLCHPLPKVDNIQKDKLYSYAYGRMHLLRKHNFPLWFKWANVIFPIYKMLRKGPSHFNYHWHMFVGRLLGLFQK